MLKFLAQLLFFFITPGADIILLAHRIWTERIDKYREHTFSTIIIIIIIMMMITMIQENCKASTVPLIKKQWLKKNQTRCVFHKITVHGQA